jgi:hypothetical protein
LARGEAGGGRQRGIGHDISSVAREEGRCAQALERISDVPTSMPYLQRQRHLRVYEEALGYRTCPRA